MPSITHITLDSGTQLDVDMGANFKFVEVLYRSGSTELWACCDPASTGIPDGSIIEADDVDVIPAGVTGGSMIVDAPSNQNTIVRLESTATVYCSLKGLDA